MSEPTRGKERINDKFGYGLEHYTNKARGIYPCFECGRATDGRHHVVPVLRGGKRQLPLCSVCHGKVHAKEMETSSLIKEGLEKAKQRGVRLGRPVIQIPDEAIYEHYKESNSIRQTAAYFGISVGYTHKVVVALRILERDENT